MGSVHSDAHIPGDFNSIPTTPPSTPDLSALEGKTQSTADPILHTDESQKTPPPPMSRRDSKVIASGKGSHETQQTEHVAGKEPALASAMTKPARPPRKRETESTPIAATKPEKPSRENQARTKVSVEDAKRDSQDNEVNSIDRASTSSTVSESPRPSSTSDPKALLFPEGSTERGRMEEQIKSLKRLTGMVGHEMAFNKAMNAAETKYLNACLNATSENEVNDAASVRDKEFNEAKTEFQSKCKSPQEFKVRMLKYEETVAGRERTLVQTYDRNAFLAQAKAINDMPGDNLDRRMELKALQGKYWEKYKAVNRDYIAKSKDFTSYADSFIVKGSKPKRPDEEKKFEAVKELEKQQLAFEVYLASSNVYESVEDMASDWERKDMVAKFADDIGQLQNQLVQNHEEISKEETKLRNSIREHIRTQQPQLTSVKLELEVDKQIASVHQLESEADIHLKKTALEDEQRAIGKEIKAADQTIENYKSMIKEKNEKIAQIKIGVNDNRIPFTAETRAQIRDLEKVSDGYSKQISEAEKAKSEIQVRYDKKGAEIAVEINKENIHRMPIIRERKAQNFAKLENVNKKFTYELMLTREKTMNKRIAQLSTSFPEWRKLNQQMNELQSALAVPRAYRNAPYDKIDDASLKDNATALSKQLDEFKPSKSDRLSDADKAKLEELNYLRKAVLQPRAVKKATSAIAKNPSTSFEKLETQALKAPEKERIRALTENEKEVMRLDANWMLNLGKVA